MPESDKRLIARTRVLDQILLKAYMSLVLNHRAIPSNIQAHLNHYMLKEVEIRRRANHG